MRDAGPVPLVALVGSVLALIFFVVSGNPPSPVPPDKKDHKPEQESGCTAEELEHSKKDPLTQIVFLLDTSGTYHQSGAFDRSLGVFESLAQRMTDDLPGPVRIQVAAIGRASATRELLCDDIHVEPATFFWKPCEEQTARHQIRTCLDRLQNVGSDDFTEISWGLDKAQRLLGPPTELVQGIILMSDLEEDLPPGVEPAEPRLSGVCVAGLYEITMTDPSPNSDMGQRIRIWTQTLSQAQAQGVTFQPLLGASPGAIIEFLTECSQQ